LQRGDEPSPTRSAVLVRLNHGHIRIGSFQRLATIGDLDGLQRLTAYALKYYYDEEADQDGPTRLLRLVAEKTAQLAAQYMTAGFVHGVLNSDNINISGESFDYGPWRWTAGFDPAFTAAYFDEQGLYAFGRQAEAIHWDVVQLAIAFTKIADQDGLIDAVNRFEPAYRAAIVSSMLQRLRVVPKGSDDDKSLATAIELGLIASKTPIDQFYFDWRGGALRPGAAPPHPAFDDVRTQLERYRSVGKADHPYWQAETPCSLQIEEVEAIWAPIAAQDDWSMLNKKIGEIRAMGAALAEK
jgi:serine/tyrosine/threonine adenylyltransferase